MKYAALAIVFLFFAGCAMNSNISSSSMVYKFETIKLPAPNMEKGLPLMQALHQRKTTREISDRKIDVQTLSEILWAANGVNRSDGKRTSPAAVNIQMVDIYVVLEEGIFLYDAVKGELQPVSQGNFRKFAGMQDFVFTAPVNLIYVMDAAKFNPPSRGERKFTISDVDKKIWAAVAIGCMTQNVGLYCASEGLAQTPRGMVDRENLGREMKLTAGQYVILAQTVGYPK